MSAHDPQGMSISHAAGAAPATGNDPFSFSPATRIASQPPRFVLRGGVYLLFLTVATGLAWASLTDVPKYVNAAGDVYPSVELPFVQTIHGGKIVRLLVLEGTEVAAGQPLFEIDSEKLQEAYKELAQRRAELALARKAQKDVLDELIPGTDKKIASARDRLKNLEELDELTFARRNIVREQADIETRRQRARLELSRRQVAVDESLSSKGFASERNVLVSQQGVIEVETELEDLNSRVRAAEIAFGEERLRIAIQKKEASEEILRLTSEMEAAERTTEDEVRRAEIQLERAIATIREFGRDPLEDVPGTNASARSFTVVAPESGTLTELKATNRGQVIADGEVLARIVPRDARIQARLQVSDSDISQVRVGDAVRFKVNAFPSVDYGALAGVITRISPSAEGNGEARGFFVYADLQQSYFRVGDRNVPLLPGMLGVADIRVGQERMIARLFRPFKALFDPADASR